MKEIIPVVNLDDKIIKYATPKEVHDKELVHREIVVYFFNKSQDILIQKRDGGFYDHSVAGHVRKGETYKQTAMRECEEEINIKLDPLKLIKIGKYYHRTYSTQKNYYNNRFFVLYYYNMPIELEDLVIDKDELEKIVALSPKKIGNLIKNKPLRIKGGTLISFPKFIKYFLKKKGN